MWWLGGQELAGPGLEDADDVDRADAGLVLFALVRAELALGVLIGPAGGKAEIRNVKRET